nr:phage tail domain-containing protein [uncultured Aminipila sp.]
MFNRQSFNRKAQSNAISGIASMKMGATAIPSKQISASGVANMKLGGTVNITNNKSASGRAEMSLKSSGNATKELIGVGNIANMKMTSAASSSLAGEAVIHLLGLVLAPKDELIINTTDMTITLNGENAMEYFSSDSEFFSLISGENIIVYNDSNSSRKASLNITWKNRWL